MAFKVNKPMAKSYIWKILVIIFSCSTVDCRGVDVGLCDKWLYNCYCGVQPHGHFFQISFNQCTYFHNWSAKCRPCDGEKPEERCAMYKSCLTCRDDNNGCTTCPLGKYGNWCNGECKCVNGGTCHSDGSCSCPPEFGGFNCEVRLRCGSPEEIFGLTWEGNGTKVADVIVGKCQNGYTLVGPKTRTCSVRGDWGLEQPFCEQLCMFPNLGPHLKTRINSGVVNKTFDADNVEIIKEIEFFCDTGYTVVGTHRIQCSNGKWNSEPPKCQLIKGCKDPGTPFKGSKIVIDDIDGAYVPGTSIKFQCSHGRFLSGPALITCVASGNWSDATPQCLEVSGCPPPDIPENGKVEITKSVENTNSSRVPRLRIISRIGGPKRPTPPKQSSNIPPGYSNVDSKALYSCKSIYYGLVGTKSRVCLPNGVWSGKQPGCKALCGQSYEEKRPTIIKGIPSVLGKWPWQVAIYSPDGDSWRLRCGGTLLNENWIVTAAHCVSEKKISKVLDTSIFRLYLGKHFLNSSLDDSEVKVFAAKKIIMHPNYHPRSMDSDIALIELMDSVTFSPRIQPICLPLVSDKVPTIAIEDILPEAKSGFATGWGIMETGTTADILQQTELGIVNRTYCEEEYRLQSIPVSVTANMFCAGWEEGGTGTCNGDSGGPFMVQDQDNDAVFGQKRKRWVLWGIISWVGSKECAAPRQYAGLLNVANFVPWIEQYI
ncbi:peptidase domain containing associated with muscle reproteinration 1 [Chamberlinius hualienensis]